MANGRLKNGRFASGNSFAKGHGAPKGNQNAKGHGARPRNTNAVKTGEFMHFEEDETYYDRVREGDSELKKFCIDSGHLLMLMRRGQAKARQELNDLKHTTR